MNQVVMRNTGKEAAALPPDQQEPISRTLRRSREDVAAAALREAQGHRRLISSSRDQSMPSSLEAKGRWRKQIDDAGAAWDRLTEGDLQALEGHQHMLGELIQVRYGVTEGEADRQVMAFIEDHLSSAL